MWLDVSVILIGAFAASVVNGITGTFFALVGMAIWLQVLPPVQAVLLVVITSILLNVIMIWRLRLASRWQLLWPFLIGSAIGVPLGVAALHHIDAHLIRRAAGVLLILYSVYMLRRPVMPVVKLSPGGGRLADGVVGLLGGFMGGAFSLNGMLPTLWCGLRGWSKAEQRCVFQPFIVATHVMTLIWLGGVGGIQPVTLRNVLLCLPMLALGGWLGLKVFNKVSDTGFRRAVLWMFILSGLSLIR